MSLITGSISNVTPELLDKTPNLLIHKRGKPDDPLQWSDGRVGAVLRGGFFFVTSPNMDIVYEPPLGKNREMFLRRNYRYADDDPLLWPQPYVSSACHYGAIPREPEHGHPMDIMWWNPGQADLLVNSSDLVLGIGKLPPNRLGQFKQLAGELQGRVQEYKSDKNHPVKNSEIMALSNWLNQGLSRLELLPMDFTQLKFGVAEVQRAYLELTAGLDYLYIYKPRMDGILPPATETAPTIGVFTMDSTIVQEFMKAGLPVWFMRPSHTLPGVRIDAIVDTRNPRDFIEFREAETKFDIVFRGSADDPAKRKAFALHSRQFFSYYNPFTLYIVTPRENVSGTKAPRGIVSGTQAPAQGSHQATFQPLRGEESRRTQVSSRSEKAGVPYRRPAKGGPVKGSGGRNKFQELSSPLLPPAIPEWRDALAAVDTNPGNRVTEQIDPVGYMFPDPGLFVSCTTEEKTTQYLHQWLRLRTAFIYRVSAASSSAQPLSNQAWRDLLNSSGEKQPSGSKSTNPSQPTKASRRSETLKEILSDCLREVGVELAPNDRLIPSRWGEGDLEAGASIPRHIIQEILYELFSLNFRYELSVLHSRAKSPNFDIHDPHNALVACFPEQSTLAVELSKGNIGLAANKIEDRLPYLLAIKRLMSTWEGPLPESISSEDKAGGCYSVHEIEVLEREVARFYTQTFFNFFGRAAIVPRRLV